MRYIKKPNFTLLLFFISFWGFMLLCLVGYPLYVISLGSFNLERVLDDYSDFFIRRGIF